MEISREVFDEQRQPRFGNANPERMMLAFWEWMIRGLEAPTDGACQLEELGLQMREGMLKSAYGPYRARDLFNIPLNRDDGPIWTFDRMGATRNQLPDGRIICIGGEHEDFYDPDFCIYNDVVVLTPNRQVEIYGYPKDVFPPTDFHTATVLGDRIVVVGGLGYKSDRRPYHTPVYSLDLLRYRLSEIPTSGNMPGWISKHEARYDPKGIITIRGGQLIREHSGEQRLRRNFEDYSLDTRSWVWQRLTNRNWHEFSISRAAGLFMLEQRPKPEALLPTRIKYAIVPRQEKEDARIIVEGVPVSVTVGVKHIDVVVEGDLAGGLAVRVVEEIRANAEAAIQSRCTLEQM